MDWAQTNRTKTRGRRGVSEPEPIKKLKGEIKGEMTTLVKAQKLSFLEQGNWFKVYKPKGKEAKSSNYTYVRLANGNQDLIYGSGLSADGIPTDTQTLKVSDVAEVTVGVNSSLFSKQKKLSPQDEEVASLSLSIVMKDQTKPSLDLVAQNRDDFVNWTDGLRVLLSDKFENPETLEELKTLVNLEVRIRLLELEGVEISHDSPKIPPLPENYNFCTS